jgi:MFS family permease
VARLRGDRDTRLIVAAVGISALGDFLLWIPLTLHIQETTDSGIAVAGLILCLWSPVVLLAPISGLLVDRRETRGLLIGASLAQAAITAALALALDSLAAILVLAALLGIGFSVAQPAEFALVPVIGKDRLAEVNGYVETSRYAGLTAGPLLGGALAAVGGVEVAMLANAATFLVVATAAYRLRARRPPGVHGEDAPGRARDGVAYLFRDRTLGIVITVAFVSLLFMSATIAAEVFYLKEDLGVSDLVYGLVFGCWTIGMMAGALLVSRRLAAGSLGVAILAAVAVQGAGVGLPAAWVAVGFAAAMWFIGGVGHGTKNVLVRLLIQRRVPAHVHGRAFAAYNGIRNSAELVALAGGGVLVAAIGARETLAIAGAVPVLAALGGVVVYRRGAGREPVPAAGDTSPQPMPEEAEGAPAPPVA